MCILHFNHTLPEKVILIKITIIIIIIIIIITGNFIKHSKYEQSKIKNFIETDLLFVCINYT